MNYLEYLRKILLNANKKDAQKLLIRYLAILLIIVSVFTIYLHSQLSNVRSANDEFANDAEAIITRVSRLMVLPKDEQPTIATVTDPERLRDQPFFANAKKGDKVLIYTSARKAILYDPVADQILEVAPINIGTSDAQNNL